MYVRQRRGSINNVAWAKRCRYRSVDGNADDDDDVRLSMLYRCELRRMEELVLHTVR